MQYQADGYLPQALLNYLVRLGWSHQDQEIFDLATMIDLFALEDVNRSGSVFDLKKLDWVNQHYLQQTDADALGDALTPYLTSLGVAISAEPPIADVADLLRERARTMTEMAEGARAFYVAPDTYDAAAAAKHLDTAAGQVLRAVSDSLAALEDWRGDAIQAALNATVDRLGIKFGKLGLPVRVCVVGGTASPALDRTLALIGRQQVLQRLERGVAYCQALTAN